jgi:hypothetical protein
MDYSARHYSSPLDLSLDYLRAELSRLDLRIQREVRRWQLAGQDPADTFRGLYISDYEANALLARPLAGNWGHSVELDPDESQALAEAEALAANQAEELLKEAEGQTPPLAHLAATFGLDRFELDTLLICLAPTLDLRYERLYAYLQDDVTRKRPTVNLVLNLLGPTGPKRLLLLARFAAEAPLFSYQLLKRSDEPGTPLLAQTLTLDETIVAWLLGDYQPAGDLAGCARLHRPKINEMDELLAALPPDLEPGLAEQPVVVFYGPDQANQEAAARLLAARQNRPLLQVDLKALTPSDTPSLPLLKLALRDARLTGAIACLLGWDSYLNDSGAPAPDVLAEIFGHPDLLILAGQALWQPKGVGRERRLLWLEFPVPGYSRRRALWDYFLSQASAQVGEAAEPALAALAAQFLLTASQIRDAVASARDMAAQRGERLQDHDLFIAARNHSSTRLGSLARKITSRYDWNDIILPNDQRNMLHEIIATVRGRPVVLDEWGVGRKLTSSQGVTVLFAGPPGTGKTMAAEIIAGELGLDLYKIDLSTVVSKYIGETEKNLEQIFHEAASSNAILFFDEADAIFGKRSEVKDAHDRYANIEVSYLLQRMEAYDGVTILATNLRANLDEAFTRRLQFAVDFPFPEEADRLRIWQALFPPDVPRVADLDFGFLARRFKLAGGNIRNIIVSAAYLAAADGGQVTMHHLLHGTRRELQKMGRLVGEDDLRLS